MGFFQHIVHDLKSGWIRMRYGTAQAATRALEEAELLRLRLELRKVDTQLADLHRDLGERAIRLVERGESAERVVTDPDLGRDLEQIRTIQAQRDKLCGEMELVKQDAAGVREPGSTSP